MEIRSEYLNGTIVLSKEEEKKFLEDQGCKNTGIFAEKYIAELLNSHGVLFKKNLRISTNESYVIPDFYLYEYDTILEIKSRSYNCSGTASEKVDNIPRKYSKIRDNNAYLNTKVVVVFCCYEILNPVCAELVNPASEYAVDFVELCKRHGVSNWIVLPDLLETLKKLEFIHHTKSLPALKPIVKWIGGKNKISKKILQEFPCEFNKYFEPFAGGACIGLKVQQSVPKYFSDINSKLINCYNTVKNDVEALILELDCVEKYVNTKGRFQIIREEFNEGDSRGSSDIELAAQFIYLNKCCFNGMYRENKSGKFNVPFGKMGNPVICDSELLRNVSKFLQNVDISCCDYTSIKPEEGDLVYFDPPYFDTFSEYSSGGFSSVDHITLKNFVDTLTARGVLVILSNSSTDFIKELYSDYQQIIIETNYSVSAKRSGRSKVQEILIKNF